MSRIAYIVFFALLVVPCISDAETIDVHIKGVDDGVKTTKQRDYKEAVLFAKREAIERAGVKIKSMTTVKDLVVNSDYIESQAEAVLLPGYNILDMGYSADGTYQVVLVGKVKTVSEGIDSKELRYAKSLMDRGESSKARKIIADIIKNSKDDNVVAEAMYCLVLWKFASDVKDTFEKLKAYYPDSKYISRLESVLAEREAERRRIEAERKAERRRIEAERKAERRRIEAERRRRIEAKIGRITESDGRFFAGNKGFVLDTKRDLEWIARPGKAITWDEARSWVENLTVDGGGWRMPTLEELWRIHQKGVGVRNRTMLLKAFGWYVWSDRSRRHTAWAYEFMAEGEAVELRRSTDGAWAFAVRSRR